MGERGFFGRGLGARGRRCRPGFAKQPGRPLNWTALGLIILIVGLAVLLGAVLSPRNGQRNPPPRADRLVSLIQTSGGALTVALAISFTFVVALVAIPLAEGVDRVTVATAAFTGIGTIAGAYFGLRVGGRARSRPNRTGRRRSSPSSAWLTRARLNPERLGRHARKFVRNRRNSPGPKP